MSSGILTSVRIILQYKKRRHEQCLQVFLLQFESYYDLVIKIIMPTGDLPQKERGEKVLKLLKNSKVTKSNYECYETQLRMLRNTITNVTKYDYECYE
jgi:hypothetical protein